MIETSAVRSEAIGPRLEGSLPPLADGPRQMTVLDDKHAEAARGGRGQHCDHRHWDRADRERHAEQSASAPNETAAARASFPNSDGRLAGRHRSALRGRPVPWPPPWRCLPIRRGGRRGLRIRDGRSADGERRGFRRRSAGSRGGSHEHRGQHPDERRAQSRIRQEPRAAPRDRAQSRLPGARSPCAASSPATLSASSAGTLTSADPRARMTARAQAKTIEGAGSKPVAKSPAAASTTAPTRRQHRLPHRPRRAPHGSASGARTWPRRGSGRSAGWAPRCRARAPARQRARFRAARCRRSRSDARSPASAPAIAVRGTEDGGRREPPSTDHDQGQRHEAGDQLELPEVAREVVASLDQGRHLAAVSDLQRPRIDLRLNRSTVR